jgi:hypothetical protein
MKTQEKVEVDIQKILAQLGILKDFTLHTETGGLTGTAAVSRLDPTS